jgi:glycosyltransferase involved in cell wall biosynthesis
VNEGWRKASGEWCAWINSDDWYQPGALNTIAGAAAQHSVDWLAGQVDDYTVDGIFLKRHPARAMELDELLGRKDYGFHQPGMFWRLKLLREVGMLDESLYTCFCPDLWAKTLAAGHCFAGRRCADRVLSLPRRE